jgi:hypothetical protein
MNVNIIYAKIWQGLSITPAELKTAKESLSSKKTSDRIAACMILLRRERLSSTTKVVIEELEDLCRFARWTDHHSISDLILNLLYVPGATLSKDKIFGDFLYKCSSHAHSACRTNAMLGLARLAKRGDRKALLLLKRARKDPSESVRRNAEAALR